MLACSPGTVTLATSDTASAQLPVEAGVNYLNVTLTPGGYMRGTLKRGNTTVVDLKPGGYTFNPNPEKYNFNVFVAYGSSA